MRERYAEGEPSKTYVKICKACGISFITNSKVIVYCSPECSGKTTCKRCGKVIYPNISQLCMDCREPLHFETFDPDSRQYKYILNVDEMKWCKVYLQSSC
jgi:uncharacterized OB-fold protein